MSESRQQRRARERREAKEALRPNPTLAAPPPSEPEASEVNQERAVEIDLYRTVSDDPGDASVSWDAEWGLSDDSVTEDCSEDLAELVDAIVENLRPLAERCALRLEWDLYGDPPEGKTLKDAVAECKVTLPEVLP
ncbi:hypothetical protein L3Q65_01180 (plasmid) [Amycolatopsis sp. FU40]|uniref:hypothetical protein n=1 Tax=Amycolatopsis sp. FU40 TaxID=2914159 RepID=UPI001F175343|nr:hypothetical protein [Amycolatopsis sp. FU40]UKD50938.1 hypothetical protein L3Q65_01180 [Amycolatopsis sp. FU40]